MRLGFKFDVLELWHHVKQERARLIAFWYMIALHVLL